jgi:hypothetical protein
MTLSNTLWLVAVLAIIVGPALTICAQVGYPKTFYLGMLISGVSLAYSENLAPNHVNKSLSVYLLALSGFIAIASCYLKIFQNRHLIKITVFPKN